ncbi:unnamed protein product [Symbiodinium natans]|uniref:Uncharacterized protein n=1 Tax=Symbiodinium natans TaxID=878477 RepID=A0A812RV15_9DINO|nr:unnamed protein product [Symbiodinium natans]
MKRKVGAKKKAKAKAKAKAEAEEAGDFSHSLVTGGPSTTKLGFQCSSAEIRGLAGKPDRWRRAAELHLDSWTVSEQWAVAGPWTVASPLSAYSLRLGIGSEDEDAPDDALEEEDDIEATSERDSCNHIRFKCYDCLA